MQPDRLQPEALRREALAALGPHADPRARDALEKTHLVLTPTATAWESSAGPVEGHAVTLAVGAQQLGQLRAAPALVDALHAALAVAIASRAGEALASLTLRWESDATHAASQGYRDRPPDPPQALPEALVSYLLGRGEPVAARAIERAVLVRRGDVVHVQIEAGGFAELRGGGPGAHRALSLAVRDLLGEAGLRVVVEPV